jgi:hypothetical protein
MQMGRRVASGFFAGGREIRISSLELAKLYSSRAYLKPSTGTGVWEQEIGEGARFLEVGDLGFPGGYNLSTMCPPSAAARVSALRCHDCKVQLLVITSTHP